jgi:hypothetical protein
VNLETGLFNCKGCGESGDVFSFHARYHNLGGFKAALDDLARRHGLAADDQPPAETRRGAQGHKASGTNLPSPAEVERFCADLLANGQVLKSLCETRGLTRKRWSATAWGFARDGRRRGAMDQPGADYDPDLRPERPGDERAALLGPGGVQDAVLGAGGRSGHDLRPGRIGRLSGRPGPDHLRRRVRPAAAEAGRFQRRDPHQRGAVVSGGVG